MAGHSSMPGLTREAVGFFELGTFLLAGHGRERDGGGFLPGRWSGDE